jgi:hypothetical protein
LICIDDTATTDVLARDRMLMGGRAGARPFSFSRRSAVIKSNEARSVFAPSPSRQESKASTTNSIARGIMETETRHREAKTARLRAMRLKAEADAPPPAPKATRARKSKAR